MQSRNKSVIEKQWITEAGLEALAVVVVRDGKPSHRCGYVKIPRSSGLYRVMYNATTPILKKAWRRARRQPFGDRSPMAILFASQIGSANQRPDLVFDVHGSITYSGNMKVIHPGATGFWYGFDCMHYDDALIEPWALPDGTVLDSFRGGIVRDLPFVESQCESMAEQVRGVIGRKKWVRK